MVPASHLIYLEKIIQEINDSKIPGDIVECGVWKGGCMMWMISCQKKYSTDRNFYLYDTFDGMTEPTHIKDADSARSIYDKVSKGEYKRDYDNWHTEKKWAYAPLDMVKGNIAKIDYESDRIHYVKGDVCKTLDHVTHDSISILRLDTDWYESTMKELTVLAPLVQSGGYIIVDDYYAWKGSHDATDDWLVSNKDEYTVVDKSTTGDIFTLRKK